MRNYYLKYYLCRCPFVKKKDGNLTQSYFLDSGLFLFSCHQLRCVEITDMHQPWTIRAQRSLIKKAVKGSESVDGRGKNVKNDSSNQILIQGRS